jgi:hypothetical protein
MTVTRSVSGNLRHRSGMTRHQDQQCGLLIERSAHGVDDEADKD